MNAILLNMVYAAVISGIITALITPLVKAMALRFKAVREVRARDSHDSEMPLWGGLAMFVGFAAVVLLMRPLLTHHEYALSVGKGEHPIAGIMIGAAIVAIIGLLDDKFDLKPWQQMGGLLLAGFVATSSTDLTKSRASSCINSAGGSADNDVNGLLRLRRR